MEAIRLHKIIEKDGEILVKDLPYKKGHVEIILLPETEATKRPLTAAQILNSGLIGIWKDGEDIGNSAFYARKLRNQAQNRQI